MSHPIADIRNEEESQTWLRSLLLTHGRRIFERCSHYYSQLCALPRSTRRRLKQASGVGLTTLALGLALAGGPPAQAATITVDGTNCTLAEAITTANDGSAQAGCTTGDGAGPDILNITADINLTAALPDITSEITIEGNGNTIARTGGPNFSVLTVTGMGNLTLNEATITGGEASSGGGISNDGGTLTVNNSTISGNMADGFAGGGIFNSGGTVTVTNSTISGNTADDPTVTFGLGGGIYNGFNGTLTITNSTISGNTGGFGGGIANSSTATITSSTISGNMADDFTGGGIWTTLMSTVTLNHTIVSGNTELGGGDSHEVYRINNATSIVNGNNYNVIGYGGDNRSENFTPSGTDVVPAGALNTVLDSMLADNGGSTLTHALVSGSPAIGLITDASCIPGTTVDQRGAARGNGANQGGTGCDAGAFEYASTQTPTAVVMSGSGAEPSATGGVAAALSALMLTAGTAWAAVRRRNGE